MASQEESLPLFEELHRKVKELQPAAFDGVRLAFNRPLSPHFQMIHCMGMGLTSSYYRIGANYTGTKQISPSESYPILASEMHSDGSMNANLIHQLNSRLKAKVVSSFAKNSCQAVQAALDYRGDNYTTSLTAANIDLIKNSGILVGHLLHQFTRRVSVGPEVIFQYGPQEDSFRTITQLSLGGRYNADKFSVDASLSSTGTHISYYQKANENLSFGAMFEADRSVGRPNASFCYQYDMTKSHTTFRGSIDTSWSVGAVLEKRFYPLPVVLSMSAVLNHLKSSTTVGLGLSIG